MTRRNPPDSEADAILGILDRVAPRPLSVRDLARQLPAAWQESIKQGRRWTYARFCKKVTRNQPWFARAFDLPTVSFPVLFMIIIGGLGSVEGCFIGAMLVGLLANYTAFLAPKVALISTIALMVVVLMWRPQGLYPVVKAK